MPQCASGGALGGIAALDTALYRLPVLPRLVGIWNPLYSGWYPVNHD